MNGKTRILVVDNSPFGAFDFNQKPFGNSIFKINRVKKELLDKIRHAWMLKNRKNNIDIIKTSMKEGEIQDKAKGKIEAVALGASTGGPRILYDVITNFPPDLQVPIFVVQHMPAGFTKAFAKRLDNNSNLKVVEAIDKEPIKPGMVYIAPGGYHMLVDSQKIKLDTSPPIHGVKPAVDKLLKSAAQYYKNRFLCCIFTGMGKDGAEGVKVVKENGGFVIVQDESTSAIYGMPKAACKTGCVDMVLPDYKISGEIIKLVKQD